MARGRRMISSTFRPNLDRCISRDGTPVVLWSDPEELVVLDSIASGWRVWRRPALSSDLTSSDEAIAWRGVRYAAQGELVQEFAEGADDADWHAFYREWPLDRCLPFGRDLDRRGEPIGMV